MAKPVQQIEDGIASGDWEKVRSGFAALTGRNAPPSPPATPKAKAKPALPKKVRDALNFYADEGNYASREGDVIAIMLDGGDRAKAALGPTPLEQAGFRVGDAEEFLDSIAGDDGEVVAGGDGGVATFADGVPDLVATVAAKSAKPAKVKRRGATKKDGGMPARKMGFVAPATNKWKDDVRIAAADVRSAHWINKNVVPAPRGERETDPLVSIECDRCNNDFVTHSSMVRGENNAGVCEENVCDRCIANARGGD